MNEFMKVLLSLSVSGTLLLLLILGLKPLYKTKFSKRWQYYIWIIVALRFLLPFTPDTTIVGSLFEKSDTTVITDEIPTNPNVPVLANTDNNETEPIQTSRDITAVAMREPFNIYACLFFIWSTLALVLFVRKITIYQSFIQYIKAGNAEVSDIKLLNLLSDCEEKLNIKTRVELSYNPLIASPMMIGFFRPRIVLPVHELEDKELSYIFVHELTHYKQKDMFYKWLIQLVVCAHWFNPFVYLLEKEVNKSCELSCDEKVISILDEKAKREYGDTLISFLKSNNLYKSSLASITLTEGAEQLKERLGAIMKFKKKSKCIIIVTAISSVFVCVCFFAIGAYAAFSATNDNTVSDAYVDENGEQREGWHVFDTYVDENGEQRFMGFGKTGPSGVVKEIGNENSTEEANDVQENENNYNPESIVGTSLKSGWTSSDNSILKGRNVSVKEDSILFSINLGQEKEVIISYDIVLDEGEYQLVYVSPDGTEQILQDGKVIQSEEKILFTQGQNEIFILSNNAIFKEIEISITGIQVSDF